MPRLRHLYDSQQAIEATIWAAHRLRARREALNPPPPPPPPRWGSPERARQSPWINGRRAVFAAFGTVILLDWLLGRLGVLLGLAPPP